MEPLTLNPGWSGICRDRVKAPLPIWKQSNVSTIWLAVRDALIYIFWGKRFSPIVRIEQKVYTVPGAAGEPMQLSIGRGQLARPFERKLRAHLISYHHYKYQLQTPHPLRHEEFEEGCSLTLLVITGQMLPAFLIPAARKCR